MKTKHLTFVGLVLFLCVNAYILSHFFFPIQFYYFADDWFVLPEKTWFSSNLEWLKHLLFFNQNRFTYTGDFMLYRPGLFFIYGVTDIFFHTDRYAQQFVLITVTVTALFFHYLLLKGYLGKILAATICIYILCLPTGIVIFHWPHLAPYLLALGFFSLGLKYYLSYENHNRDLLKAGAAFTLATLFHELAVVALAGYFFVQLFFSWRNKTRILPLIAPLFLYFSMAGAIALNSSLPLFYDNQQNAVQWNDELFKKITVGIQNLGTSLLYYLLPFSNIDEKSKWPVASISLAVIVFGAFLFLKRKEKNATKAMIPFAIALGSIIAGVLVGRVVPRGGFAPYYYVLMLYFLLPMIAFCYSPIFKKYSWIKISVVTLLTISNFRYIFIKDKFIANDQARTQQQMQLVEEIQDQLNRQPDRCFGGSLSNIVDSETSYLLNINFADTSCDSKQDKKSAIFLYSLPEYKLINQIQAIGEPSNFQKVDDKNLTKLLTSLSLSNFFGFNIAQTTSRPQDLRAAISLELIPSTGGNDGFEFEIRSNDPYPILYNYAFEIKSKGNEPILILFQNNYVMGISNPHNFKTSLPYMAKNQKIRIFRDGGFLFVMDSNQLLLQMPVSFTNDSSITFFGIDNGTPFEEVVHVAELHSKNLEADGSSLKYFIVDGLL